MRLMLVPGKYSRDWTEDNFSLSFVSSVYRSVTPEHPPHGLEKEMVWEKGLIGDLYAKSV